MISKEKKVEILSSNYRGDFGHTLDELLSLMGLVGLFEVRIKSEIPFNRGHNPHKDGNYYMWVSLSNNHIILDNGEDRNEFLMSDYGDMVENWFSAYVYIGEFYNEMDRIKKQINVSYEDHLGING